MNQETPAPEPAKPHSSLLARLAAGGGTLVAATMGGVAARYGGLPLPWLLGPLFATAVVGLAGVPIAPIRYGRTIGQVVIGGAIGVQFTRAILVKLVELLPLMVAVAVVAVVIGAIAALIMMRIGHVDRATAFFATTPGGVAEMLNVAPRYGAQLEPIMVAQTLRVGLIVAVAPFLVIQVAQTGVQAVGATQVMTWPTALMLVACSAVGGALFAWSTFPNAWFLGSIAVGIVLATIGLAEGRLPDLILIPAQILIGASLGVQFRREFLTRLLRLLIASTVAIAFTSSCLALIAAGVAVALKMPIPTLVLAFAPAGMAEMVLTAKLLGLDGTVVAGSQLVRIIVIMLLCRPAYLLFARLVPGED